MRTACRTHSSLITGSMPGIAASTSETWLFGSPPNAVEAPENSFEFEVTWAWTSRPITISQSPVAPLISLPLAASCSSSEQRGNDPLPFGFERILRHRLAGLAVPIAGIAEIAFDAVQIGVHPGRVALASSWTILCAWSQLPLAAHHSAASGAARPGAGAAPDRLALKSAIVTTTSPA